MSPGFLSVVIPAYNEAENIAGTIKDLKQVLGKSSVIRDFEILVVDDHSSDGTFERVRALGDSKVRSMRLSRRSGSHTAIRAGLAHRRGDSALCISADGQEERGVLEPMFLKLQAGAHVVWGVRRQRQENFLARFFAALAYRIIISFSGVSSSNINLSKANFFLLSKKVIDAVNACPERNTSLLGLVLWVGFNQDFVEYDRQPRKAGTSKWSFRSRVRLFKDWVIAFSGVPLKLISWIGLATAAAGFLYAFFILLYALFGHATPGWAETTILILILGGLQMLMLGVVGEYLWRTLDETRKRPLYFIEDSTGAGS